MLVSLGHVCVAAFVGYLLAGLAGVWCLLRFRHLECLRRRRPWHCVAHYACYGVFLLYLVTAVSMRGSSDAAAPAAPAAASVWRTGLHEPLPPRRGRAIAQAPPSPHTALLGHAVREAFLHPWTRVPTGPPSATPAASRGAVSWARVLAEVAVQHIAATALFVSFVLLSNARWRYAVRRPARILASTTRAGNANEEEGDAVYSIGGTASVAPGEKGCCRRNSSSQHQDQQQQRRRQRQRQRPSQASSFALVEDSDSGGGDGDTAGLSRSTGGCSSSSSSSSGGGGGGGVAGRTPSTPARNSRFGAPPAGTSQWRCVLRRARRRWWGRSSADGVPTRVPHTRQSIVRSALSAEVQQRLLSAPWLSDVAVAVIGALLFAVVAVARLAVAVAVASVWASTTSTQGVHGSAALASDAAAAALPSPTEGLVGLGGLLLLAVQRVRLRYSARLAEQLLAVTSASVHAARREQLRQRLLLARRSPRRPGPLRGGGELSRTGSADSVWGDAGGSAAPSVTPAPLPFRHVWTVAVLLCVVQVCPDSAWAWAVAVGLTAGCAVASLADAVVGPLREVVADYRQRVGGDGGALAVLCLSASAVSAALERRHARGRRGSLSSLSTTVAVDDSVHDDDNSDAAAAEWRSRHHSSSSGGGIGSTLGAYVGLERDTHPAASRSTEDQLAGESHIVSTSFAGSGATADAAAAASAVLGDSAACTFIGAEYSVVEDVLGDDAAGVADVAEAEAEAAAEAASVLSPMHFWDGVAAKAMQQSAAAAAAAGGADAGVGIASSLQGSFAGAGIAASLQGSFVGLRRRGDAMAPAMTMSGAEATFLGVTDPFAAVSATGPPTPLSPLAALGHLAPASTHFTRDNLKGSMLLSLPTVARLGGEAEAAAEAAAEVELLQQQQQQQQQASASMPAARDVETNSGDTAHAAGSPLADPVQSREDGGSGGGTDADVCEAPQDGWLARALATVVPSLAATRRSSGSGDGPAAATPTPSRHDSTSDGSGMSLTGSFASYTSAAARALIDSEEGFARFLDCVRRDGDNTYALQNLLSVHGHTYRQRVDATGRSAMHHAAMGGFVHGAVFLARIGAELNVLDSAGYAPLHYAVLHHTEVRLSPHITDESPSAAVHEARHILGIPVVATAAVQAPAQTQRRRRRRQQQQELEWVQAQLHAAYATTTSDEGRQAAAQAGSSADVNVGTTSASASVTRTTSVPSRGGSGLLSTRSTSRVTSPPTLATFPNDQQQQQQQEQQATASAAAAAAVMAAVVVPEEKGQWYGMVGALVRLGAQVDLATAKGLTALHLAVMQDSIGLVNTLLREGANPLLGSELETPSLASAMHATAWSACGSTGSSSSSDAGDGDDDSGPTGGSGGRGRGRGADATAAGVCRPQPSPAQHHQPHKQQQHQQHREWLEVHVTNAGNPIANGYCKSPLLLAVELDSDLVVASMLYHAALHATTAKAVAGLPQNPVSAPHVSPSPSASAAAAAAAASLVSTANDAAAPHLLHYTPLGPLFPVDSANASSLRSASAVAAPKSASPLAAAANPLSDHGVDEGGEQQQQQQQQQQAVTAQTSTNSAAPLTSTSTITTTTTTLTTLASSQARKRVGQCCLHGLQPVHIALLLGNAQATRVLLLCWSYAEDAVPAAPADARLSREEQSLASSKAHKDLVDTVATLALPQSVEEAQRPATVAQVTLPAPQTATEMSSNSDGDGDSGAAAAAAAAASAAAAAAPPTATLRLVHATAGTGVLRTAPLHLNLFHLAAVGDSTECLAYVLRWRGAPDYIACALDEVFRDTPRDDAARRATTTATTTWHTTQDAYRRRRRQRRQQKRLCAQQGSHAAPSLAMAAMAPPPPRSEGAGQQHAAEVDEDPLHTQLSGTRPTGAVVAVVDVAGKTRSDGTVSPATSDVFNQTWSSGGPSAAERGSADTTSTTRRARRMRAKHQTFVRALLALLQTNGRGDAVRRRLRSTVLGTGAVLRRAARCSAAAEARGRSPQPPSRCVHDGDEEEGVGVCDVGGGAAAVEAATCYGSTAAAAALHTGMVECYATMGVPLHRRYRRRTQGGDGDGDGDGDDNGDNGAAPPSGPRALYVQAKELERVRRLRQQRVRAFASAVATLRQSIPGVPIDIAHLAAVEAAVDRVCAHTSSTTPATRRALQQALLVVTRRLQNQHRRTRLEHGLSRVTAAAAAAAAVAAATTSEAAEEEEEEDQTEDDEGGPLAATSSDRVRHDGAVRRGSSLSVSPSAHTRQLRQRRRGGAAVYGQSHHRRRSSSSSSSSHYRHRHDEDDHDHTGGGGAASLSRHDSLSSTAATADEAARRVAHEERRQQTLRLLRAIADEVNAVDACGLTPLHYAIAHENASMVYLLCAYGATFVFASEATETHLMKHPAEAVAAAVAEERHTSSGGNDNNNNGGGGGGGGGVVTFVAASAATDDRPAAPPPRGGILSSPATATAAWTSARAKLSTPAITTASTALSAASAHHHARLTPATRDALRRVAKAGNAEQLLRWMPTEAERAVEERQLLQQHQQRHDGAHAAPANPAEGNTSWPPPPQHPQQHQQHGPRSHTSASDTAETASATSQRSAPTRVQPTGLASVRVPSSTTTATAIATAAATAATAADPHAPTTMAATLTAALGIDDVAGGGGTAVAGDTPGAGAELRTTGDGVDVVSLRMRLVDDEDRALQTMVGGGGGSEGASCHAEGEGAADSDPLGPTAPATSLRLLSTAASSSTSTTTASASNAVASAAGGADAAAAAEATTVPAYTLLEPHDVYLTHVVRNPTTADSVVRAAMEGTALRYLHLTSLVAGEATL